MADTNIVNMVEMTEPQGTDIIYIVDSPGASPQDRKVSLDTVFQNTYDDVVLGKGNAIETGADVGAGYVVIGSNNEHGGVGAGISNLDSVIIGSEIHCDNVPHDGGGAFTDGCVVIGNYSEAHNGRCVAIGHWSYAGSVSATAYGTLSSAFHSHDVAIGRGAHTSPNLSSGGNCCIGSFSNDDLYIGSSINHRYDNPEGTEESTVPSAHIKTLHGSDAYDDVDGTDTNVAGGDLALAGGRGTGSGVGGSVKVQIARTGAGANVKNTLVDIVEFDDDNANDSTAMLLWADGSLQRVTVGAADSGGAGYRVLRIPN